jgi:teichuronic acid biosynthesis glycosyltransferase TuaC
LRPKILSFTTVFPRAGDEQHGLFVRARLAAAARLADIEVVAPVAVAEYGNPGRRVPPLTLIPELHTGSGLRVHHPRWFYPPLVNWTAPLWLYLCTRAAVRAVRASFPFELIDAHWGHPEGGAAARLAHESGVPFTVTLRGNEPEHAGSPRRREMLSAAVRRAARVIAVSQSLAAFAVALGADERRVCVIPNGIDAGVFHPRDREMARARLGMEAGALHVLSAGHLIELKGHHRLIEAAAQLRAEGVDARVWIAGGPGRHGDFAGAIRATAARTGMTPLGPLPRPVAPGRDGRGHVGLRPLLPRQQPRRVAQRSE